MEENRCRARSVIGEVEKSVVGKTDILRKVMTAILAGGHVLIEDGNGKDDAGAFVLACNGT